MDTAHWPHQDLGLVKPMEELIPSSSAAAVGGNNVMARPPQQLMGGGGGERRVRPQKEQALNCPRCNSTNTKFCYYNNYSLTQPRYFCKTCRRYWTEGGSLRNVPVGGGSRKNKRSSSSSTSASASASSSTSANTSSLTTSLPTLSSSASSSTSKNPKFQEGQDLNLAFPALPEFGTCANAATTTATNLSAMELLRGTGMQQGGRGQLNPFMPMHAMTVPEYPLGFGLQDFRTNSLGFPLDHGGASGGYGAGLQEGGAGRLLFPFEESRGPVSSNAGGGDQFDQNNKGEPPGFWNGMMGGGGGGGGSCRSVNVSPVQPRFLRDMKAQRRGEESKLSSRLRWRCSK